MHMSAADPHRMIPHCARGRRHSRHDGADRAAAPIAFRYPVAKQRTGGTRIPSKQARFVQAMVQTTNVDVIRFRGDY